MDAKNIVKGIWKRSKTSFVIGVWNILSLFVKGKYLRFGSWLTKPIVNWLEPQVCQPWNPTKEELRELIRQAGEKQSAIWGRY